MSLCTKMLPDCHEISLRIREELKNGKISDKCQITSYPLPPQPNNDNIYSDKRLEVCETVEKA